MPDGLDLSMPPYETLHHVAIAVSDLDRAKRFYGDLLGFREIPRPAFAFPGAWYRVGDRDVHLIVVSRSPLNADAALQTPDAHAAFRVKDFRAARQYLESRGVPMRVTLDGPTGFPQIHVMDPDRNVIEINAARIA